MALFRENMEPRCIYCEKSVQLEEHRVGCPRYGVVSDRFSCRQFVYDPFKRMPPKPVKLGRQYSDNDFSIAPGDPGKETKNNV